VSGLPEGWVTTSVSDINNRKSKNIKPSDFPEEIFELYSVPIFPTGCPEFVQGKDIGSSKQIVNTGDLLLCKINPRINRVWTVGKYKNHRQIASSEWIVITQPNLNIDFLKSYFTESRFRELLCSDVTGVGGSLTRAQPKKVATYPVLVAPLNEQIRIANKLDSLLGKLQATQKRLDKIPSLLKRYRQSILAAAVSGELTKEWRRGKSYGLGTSMDDFDWSTFESGEELFRVPSSWSWTEFGTVIEIYNNKRIPLKLADRNKRSGKYPYYGAFGIIDDIDDFIFNGRFLLLAEDGKNLESRLRPISLIADGKFWVNNHAHVIQAKKHISLDYLMFFLNSPLAPIDQFLTGMDQVKLNKTSMIKIPIPIPPPKEQKQIVKRVEALFKLADQAEQHYLAAKQRTDKLTQSILAKAFRGELVPQDPNDEPASELLARIQAEKDK